MSKFKITIRKRKDKPPDPEIINWISKSVQRDWNCIDLGANIGVMSLYMSRRCTKGQVLALEPEPNNFRLLQKNVSANNANNIKCLQYAVYSSSRKVHLWFNCRNSGDHRCWNDRATLEGRRKFSRKTKVRSLTLDMLARAHTNSAGSDGQRLQFDFVKMDIQGAECKAMEAMEDFMNLNPNCIFLTEFWPYGIEGSGDSVKRLCYLIDKYFSRVYSVSLNKKIRCNVNEIDTRFLLKQPSNRGSKLNILLKNDSG